MNDPTAKAHADALLLMRMAQFNYEQLRVARIWAARANPCEDCGAEPYEPCWNGNELRKGNKVACRNPHADRIDWVKLKKALIERLLGE